MEHENICALLETGSYPRPTNGIVLVDIDGTLADIAHRLHFIMDKEGETNEFFKKNWKGFFSDMKNDVPRRDIVDIVMGHHREGREIFILTARPDIYREETEKWLMDVAFAGFGCPYRAIFMRPSDDKRPDTEVKSDIYHKYFKDLEIVEIIEDRPAVIRMWKELGLNTRDVGDGQEF